ncbi:MAG: hypothetical protein ND866_30600 [Pyrinomonadaceae bacterium]|nr:hypothetical protein [Pyrinomonadaceae bacterium]
MNTVTGYVAIVSLLLAMALAGGTAKKQESVNSQTERNIAPSRIALNHNETIVSDATSVQQEDSWSQFLTNVQVFIFNKFSSYAPGAGVRDGCEEFGCGGNHNETMLSDATSVQQTNAWGQLLTSVEAFIFNRFTSYVPGGGPHGCDDEFGCGTNNNETMVSDATSIQQADPWSLWLTSLQGFISRFSSYAPGGGVPGGCEEFGCGMNHNETMVRNDSMK